MLFEKRSQRRPLAYRMAPESLDEFVGQDHILGPGRPLRRLIEEGTLLSAIFFGPPGTGKTALARIIARKLGGTFVSLNAVTAGVRDIKEALRASIQGPPVVFIDEIHRFNKLQQDALLPHVESGDMLLIGASTENPFFALVPALASRSMLFEFKPLKDEELLSILKRAISDPRGLGEYDVRVSEDCLKAIVNLSGGDARRALNILEAGFLSVYDRATKKAEITPETISQVVSSGALYYDRQTHYDLASALQKSMRGSDPDATVYYLARMLEAGEDPMFIARRIVVCAAEDVGNADPQALVVATSAMVATEKIGLPEARIPLAQAALYVATAPKSNASYLAIERAIESVQKEPLLEVPDHLRDAHYRGADKLGRGTNYLYPHNYPGHYVNQKYLPEERLFYEPTEQGYEKTIKSLMEKRRKQKP